MSFDFQPQDTVLLSASQEANVTRPFFSEHNQHSEHPEHSQVSAYHGDNSRASQCSDSTSSARASAQRVRSDISSTCAASNSPIVVNSTSNIQSFDSHVDNDSINIKREYAFEISRLRAAQRRWMTAAADLQNYLNTNRNAPHASARLEKAWSDILDIEARARRYELTLNALDGHGSSLEIFTPLEDVNPPMSSTFTDDYPTTAEYSTHSTSPGHSSPPLPEVVELFYKHASAIRYISDELVNLGPRPMPHITVENIGSFSDASDNTTPHEYAERHLELLRDLAFARQEADKYKRLCVEQGFELEDETPNPGIQGDDIYISILNELEHGAARIDSMMVLNAIQEQHPSSMTSAAMPSQGTSRVAEWAASVASQSNEPLDSTLLSQHQVGLSLSVARYTEPLHINDGNRMSDQGGMTLQRMPSRRRSTSKVLQMRQKAAAFSGPARSDSGIDLQEMERNFRFV